MYVKKLSRSVSVECDKKSSHPSITDSHNTPVQKTVIIPHRDKQS